MKFFEQVLASYHSEIKLINSSPVAGGCINSTYKLVTNQGPFFLKWNSESQKDMIHADAAALSYLSQQSQIRTPAAYLCTEIGEKSILLLEWIEQGHTSQDFWKAFGEQLAQQHKITNDTFGWEQSNFIGSLPQRNRNAASWSDFFVEERLLPQIKLAQKSNLIDHSLVSAFEKLFNQLDRIVPVEKPALLHGDLWSGNFLCAADSQPVIFDPSIHFGHRETELSFTALFGGFDPVFYESYARHYPLENGFEDRKGIHNLYPLLVHVNLFGPSYLSGIRQTLKRFT